MKSFFFCLVLCILFASCDVQNKELIVTKCYYDSFSGFYKVKAKQGYKRIRLYSEIPLKKGDTLPIQNNPR
jgi:hypothetical protein